MFRVSNTEAVFVTDCKLTALEIRRQFACWAVCVTLTLLLFLDCYWAWAEESGDAPATGAAANEPTRSNYSETVPVAGGSQSVGAELIDDDDRKSVLFDIDFSDKLFPGFHDRKKRFNERTGIAFNADYSLLAQRASFSFNEKDAASSALRIYGNWLGTGSKGGRNGSLVFKFENRRAIWGDQTPRELGFNTGSALSSANFDDSGSGFTDFYWKQQFEHRAQSGFVIGHMFAGDFADQHVLLNAWTNLINDAFFYNPSEAIPKRGFGIAGRLGLPRNWYVGAGVHDANGKGNEFGFQQFRDSGEAFVWAEIGFLPRDDSPVGESTHAHFWHQDERIEAGVEESYGFTFSTSRTFDNGIMGAIRAGYSEGDAPQMREYLGFATSFPMVRSDRLKFGVGWGSPRDNARRSQTVVEILYRWHLTHNITISPDLQVTFNPSFNEEKDTIYIIGTRFRYNF